MPRVALDLWPETQGPGGPETRGTPRRPPPEGAHPAHYGAHRDRNAACLDEFGITFKALAALVVLAARAQCGSPKTTRAMVEAVMLREEELTAGGGLRELERLRLAREVGRIGTAGVWEATEMGRRKVMGWTGRSERTGLAAAE